MSKKPAARATAREFYTNVIELGKMARDRFLADIRQGKRAMDITELRELETNIEICEKELAKYQ